MQCASDATTIESEPNARIYDKGMFSANRGDRVPDGGVLSDAHVIQFISPHRMKEHTVEGFGLRLKAIRRGRALTQQELGDRVGVTQRVIAYYESDDAQPPGALLVDLAQALEVSSDELLGIEPLEERVPAKRARLRRRLQRVEELPAADQRAVLRFVDALVDSRGIDNGS